MKKNIYLTFVFFTGLLMATALACGSSAPTQQVIATAIPQPTEIPQQSIELPTSIPAPTTMPAQPPAGVGERVQSGGVALTVNGTTTTKDTALGTLEEGKILVVCDVTIENIGTERQPYNLFYFKVRDIDGFEYTTSMFSPAPTMNSGEISPGEKTRGNVAFEVKPGIKGLVLIYTPMVILNTTEIKIILGDVPQ